ncbi:hypothetical protein RKE29_05780 [Streptomyces sp. B1866]|uniref:hypothetical protein n=1 Tax=Streptomyces sp. B1866 TaxID=3075431 RepID=UPI002890AEAC|nr:hypothetical protein [Streptomyces sp. B1866]MDT3396154.1 hypothetical protein [Streptomyces sp. B1866]
MPLSRLFALWAARLRLLAAAPRGTLLGRGHHQWTGAACLAVLALPALFGRQPDTLTTAVILPAAAASWALDLAGAVAHIGWERGLLWPGVACPCCGPHHDGPGGNGGGPGDGAPPPGPGHLGDDHRLTPADLAWLDNISRLPHPGTATIPPPAGTRPGRTVTAPSGRSRVRVPRGAVT